MGKRIQGKGRKALKKLEASKRKPEPKGPVRSSRVEDSRLDHLVSRSVRGVADDEIPALAGWHDAPGAGRTVGYRDSIGQLNTSVLRCKWVLQRAVGCPAGWTSLYHGTIDQNAATILTRGLLLPKRGRNKWTRRGGMFGRGLYFAKAREKSLGFVGHAGCLLSCFVDLGRCVTMLKSENTLNRETLEGRGYDSVHGAHGQTLTYGSSTLRNDEWVIYDSARVIVWRCEYWVYTPAKK
jgi:hypothetical protein